MVRGDFCNGSEHGKVGHQRAPRYRPLGRASDVGWVALGHFGEYFARANHEGSGSTGGECAVCRAPTAHKCYASRLYRVDQLYTS